MGIILVYDCTDQQTFNNISNWLRQIDQHATPNVAKVLVANKCDKPDKIIETERGRELAEKHGLSFFETSAKTGHNVSEVFHHIAKVIVREKLPQAGISSGGAFGQAVAARNQNQPATIKMSNKDYEKEKKKESTCC